MWKFILFFGITIITFSTASAQSKVLLADKFKNNKNGWRLQNDTSFLVDINDGVLHIEKFKKNFTDRGCLWYTKEIDGLNTLEDFSITVYAKFFSGGDVVDMIDLQWGTWDKIISSKATSIYQLNFLIKGDVKLDYFNKTWNYSLRQKSKEILDRNLYRPNEYNKYELIQKDGFVVFNINDKQYFKQFASPIAGNTIGFQGCLKAVWEVDKIIVKQLNTSSTKNKVNNVQSNVLIDSTSNKPIEETLNVYPNPFINEFTIQLPVEKSTTAKIELFDINGKLILECDKKLDAGENTIRLYADVAPGTYILKSTIDNKQRSAKLIKQ